MIIGNKNFDDTKTHIMGILNVTPDSFSDGGRYNQIDTALNRTEQMILEGAEIIDVGGESTRPGYIGISADEEIGRVVPVVEAIKARFDISVSVDTYKNDVAAAVLAVGADMINDIWGLKHDCEMARTIKRYDVPVCLMHNRVSDEYNDFLTDYVDDIRNSIMIAHDAGISDDKIILDPGVGFAKTYERNLMVTNRLGLLKSLGYPVLLGVSRKSVIGITLGLDRDERLEGTIAASVMACMQGAMFVRVHDVKENFRAVKMCEAIKNS